jgi:hypothetical protein
MALAVVTLVIGTVLWWYAANSSPHRVTLPDGREFTIRAVTYGTEHRYVAAATGLRPFIHLLPFRMRNRLDASTITFTTATPSLVVWGSWQRTTGTNQASRLASVRDDTGRETEPKYPSGTTHHASMGMLMAWEFANYPRRQRAVTFSILKNGRRSAANRLATFHVPNPAPIVVKEWHATPFPAVARDGDLSISLTRLTSSGPDRPAMEEGRARSWGTAFFRIERNGEPDHDWTVETVELSDASGNEALIKPVHRQRMGDEWFWLFDEPIWPSEPAVKARAEFSRKANFPANDVISVRHLGLPEDDEPVLAVEKFERHGVDLATIQVQRARSSLLRGPDTFRRTHELRLTALPLTNGVRLVLIDVRDSLSREMPRLFEYATPSGQQVFSLEVPTNATSIDVRVAISRSRFAEFVVAPIRSTP